MAPRERTGTAPLLGEALHQAPSALGHEPGRSNPQGPLPTLCHPQSPSDFLQVSNHFGLIARWSKNKATDPQTGSIETRAPVHILLKLGSYLSNNTHLGNVHGQMADNRLGGQTHRRLMHGEL
jgi:hypothetical protein